MRAHHFHGVMGGPFRVTVFDENSIYLIFVKKFDSLSMAQGFQDEGLLALLT